MLPRSLVGRAQCLTPEAVRPSPTSARHRRQHYWALARRRLVNLAVGALNFQAGECKSWMPMSLRTWRPLTSEQRRHVNQIERLVSRWGHTKVEDLSVGRKGEELAEFVQALQSHIHTLSLELGSYASSGRVVPGAPSKGFIPVDPARLAFPDALEGCRISEHLGPYLLAAYEEPLVLRSTVPREPTAAHPRFHGSKQQLVEVFRRWARVGRFGVIPAKGIPKSLLTQVAAVPKDIGEDRQILDERGINSIEDQITEGPSKHLPSGFLLLDAHLQPSEQLILGAKDRKSFYHQFEVSDARMRRTPVGAPLYGADLATLDGCEGLGPRSKYLGCFRGLGMGDHIAVDVALEGHEALLQEYGALDDSTWVRGDRPVPGGDALVAVIIDDLLVATKAPRHSAPDALPRSSRRDLDIFALADAGYLAGGMPGAPEKDKIGRSSMVAGGVEIEGRRGVGGAPRDRLLPLSYLSMRAAALQEVTEDFVDSITGTWTSALLARRPLLVVLQHLYHVRGPSRKAGVCFPRKAASELVVAAALAPLAAADLRAPYIHDLFATDASPSGGGITVVRDALNDETADTLWRHRERKGGYTRLEVGPVEAAIALGEDVDLDCDFGGEDWTQQQKAVPTRPVAEKWDVLFVFGADPVLQDVLGQTSLRVGPPFDRKLSPFFDITAARSLEWLVFLARGRRVGAWIFLPPGLWVSPTRPLPRAKREQAALALKYAAFLFQLISDMGDVAVTVSPARSCAASAIRPRVGEEVSCDFCALGAPYHRGVRIHGSRIGLEPLSVSCELCAHARGHDDEDGTELHPGLLRTTDPGKDLQRIVDRWWPAAASLFVRAVAAAIRERLPPDDTLPEKGYQTPWTNSLARSAPWEVLDQWRWKRGGHINVLEAGAERRLLRHLSRKGLRGRFVLLEDSRVTLLGGAKGRTSSRALRGQMCFFSSLSNRRRPLPRQAVRSL